MSEPLKKCECPPLEEPKKKKEKKIPTCKDGNDLDLLKLQIPTKPTTTLCYRAGCCPSCVPCCGPPCGPCGPCKSLGVECGGRHDVEITVNPRIDMKEIDACVRCCTCCGGTCSGPCKCSRCLASPPHNKRPIDCGVPCLPIAPRLPVPFGLRCSPACPSPPCVPPPCPPVIGSPCCLPKCP